MYRRTLYTLIAIFISTIAIVTFSLIANMPAIGLITLVIAFITIPNLIIGSIVLNIVLDMINFAKRITITLS